MNPAVVQLDKKTFGDDVGEFRPERWLEASPERMKGMEKGMLFWGAGTRSCVGKNVSSICSCVDRKKDGAC